MDDEDHDDYDDDFDENPLSKEGHSSPLPINQELALQQRIFAKQSPL